MSTVNVVCAIQDNSRLPDRGCTVWVRGQWQTDSTPTAIQLRRGSGNGGGGLTADFQSIQDNVFTPICTKCHQGAGAPEGTAIGRDPQLRGTRGHGRVRSNLRCCA